MPGVKNLSANAGDVKDTSSIPGLGRCLGEGHDNPLQYSCLENPMDKKVWQATVHRVAKSHTRPKKQHAHIFPLYFVFLVLFSFGLFLNDDFKKIVSVLIHYL